MYMNRRLERVATKAVKHVKSQSCCLSTKPSDISENNTSRAGSGNERIQLSTRHFRLKTKKLMFSVGHFQMMRNWLHPAVPLKALLSTFLQKSKTTRLRTKGVMIYFMFNIIPNQILTTYPYRYNSSRGSTQDSRWNFYCLIVLGLHVAGKFNFLLDRTRRAPQRNLETSLLDFLTYVCDLDWLPHTTLVTWFITVIG